MATPRDPLTGKFLKKGEKPISQAEYDTLEENRKAKLKEQQRINHAKSLDPETGKRRKSGGRKKGTTTTMLDIKRATADKARIQRIEEKMRREFMEQLEKDGRVMLQGEIDKIKEKLIDPLVELSNFIQDSTRKTEKLDALKTILPYLYSKQSEKAELDITGTINYDDARNKVQQLLNINPIVAEVVPEKEE